MQFKARTAMTTQCTETKQSYYVNGFMTKMVIPTEMMLTPLFSKDLISSQVDIISDINVYTLFVISCNCFILEQASRGRPMMRRSCVLFQTNIYILLILHCYVFLSSYSQLRFSKKMTYTVTISTSLLHKQNTGFVSHNYNVTSYSFLRIVLVLPIFTQCR